MSETQTITETEPQAGLPASVPDVSDASTGGDQDETSATEAQTPEPAPTERPWYEKVIAAKAHEARELKREVAELRARATAPQAAAQQGQQPAGYVPIAQVQDAAAELVADERFAEECNAIADIGEAKYADFGEALSNWQLLGGPPRPLLEAITALGKEEGARVYYELGKDPSKAQKLLSMSSAKMIVAATKMGAAPLPPLSTTKAPDPIRPISSGRVANNTPENMTDAEFKAFFLKNYNPYKRRS